MPLSENERLAAVKQAAQLGAEYFKALVAEGVERRDAIDMANNVVLMYLSSKGVIEFDKPDDSDDPWKDGR